MPCPCLVTNCDLRGSAIRAREQAWEQPAEECACTDVCTLATHLRLADLTILDCINCFLVSMTLLCRVRCCHLAEKLRSQTSNYLRKGQFGCCDLGFGWYSFGCCELGRCSFGWCVFGCRDLAYCGFGCCERPLTRRFCMFLGCYELWMLRVWMLRILDATVLDTLIVSLIFVHLICDKCAEKDTI